MLNFRNILRNSAAAVALTAAAWGVSSCDSVIYDDLPVCGAEIRFVYDYNMEFGDAFAQNVDCLSLIIYDENGNFVGTRSASAIVPTDDAYAMKLDLPAGNYRLVAYGGITDDKSTFRFLKNIENTTYTDRRVEMATLSADRISSSLLHPLYYGALDINIPDPGEEVYTKYTLKLMKNTNDFRIILQHTNNAPILAKDYEVEIIDDNTLFEHDNSMLQSQGVTYRPFDKGNNNLGDTSGTLNNIVATFDLSTSRLINQYSDVNGEDPFKYTESASASPSRATTVSTDPMQHGTAIGSTGMKAPRLRITRADSGTTVVDIPLIPYLNLFLDSATQQHRGIGLQEFLDRQSRRQMFFLHNENDGWVNAVIQVNDWTVRVNDIGDF